MKRMILVVLSATAMALACDSGGGEGGEGGGGEGGGDMCGGLCLDGQYCWNGACLNGCTSDANCADDQYCVIDDEFFNEGRCHDSEVPGCQSDADCLDTQECLSGACVAQPEEPTACEWKPDMTDGCPADQVCIGDPEEGETTECYAMPACGADGSCPTDVAGAVCNVKEDGSKIIPSKTGICLMGLCLGDDDCPAAMDCVSMAGDIGACLPEGMNFGCESDDDCAADETCEMGMCIPDMGF